MLVPGGSTAVVAVWPALLAPALVPPVDVVLPPAVPAALDPMPIELTLGGVVVAVLLPAAFGVVVPVFAPAPGVIVPVAPAAAAEGAAVTFQGRTVALPPA